MLFQKTIAMSYYWRNEDQNLAVIIFRNEDDYDKIQNARFNKGIFEKYTSNLFDYSIEK